MSRLPHPSGASKTRSVYAVTAVLCGLIAAGSWGLNRALPGRGPTAAAPVSPPVLRKMQGDLVGVDRDGKPAAFSSMRGRVTACAYLYTRCPHGCAHVFTTMRDLQHHFAANSEFIMHIP